MKTRSLIPCLFFVLVACGTGTTRSPEVGLDSDSSESSFTSLTLMWEAASDDVTASADLEYALYQSSSNNMNSLAETLANGTEILPFTANTLSHSVTDLNPGTTYYFTVLVRDWHRNVSAYPSFSATTRAVDVALRSGAYELNTGEILQDCQAYQTYSEEDANYWIDPDGEEAGLDPFIVGCDMTGGGFIELASSADFPFTNQTNTTVSFFTVTELQQLNALRAVSAEIEVETDISLIYRSDTTAGGCGGAPVIAQGEMSATTLSFSNLTDNTETLREFYGSADAVQVEFNSTTQAFDGTRTPPCADTILDQFGTGESVILLQVVLDTNDPSRAFARLSGTSYVVRLR